MSGIWICSLPRLRRRLRIVSAIAVASALFAFALPRVLAQDKPTKSEVDRVLAGLGRGHGLGPVAISPDGTLLAYVRLSKDGPQVELAPFSDPAKTTRITAAKKDAAQCGEGMIAWAPDSRRLAFVGNCLGGGQDQVFLASITGDFAHGKPKADVQRLTEAHGEVGYPEFSPDGTRIAFLYVEGATRAAGALAAMKPWAGVIGEDGIEIQRVAMVDANSHKPAAPTFATPAQLHVYEFDW